MKNINLENNDYITSYRFARLSDVVYSEVLTENQYSESQCLKNQYSESRCPKN